MENTDFILKNKPIPKAAQPVIEQMKSDGENILFVIVGDLGLNGKYTDSALIFTDSAVVSVNGSSDDARRYSFADMKEVEAKRMYGNATLSALMPSGKREVFFRYTYSVAALCDASALFINHVNDGAELNEEIAVMADHYNSSGIFAKSFIKCFLTGNIHMVGRFVQKKNVCIFKCKRCKTEPCFFTA